LGGDEIRRRRIAAFSPGPLLGRGAVPAQLPRVRQPLERLLDSGQVDALRAGRQEVEERVEERRLAGPTALRRHDHRLPRFDEEPEERGELRVERACPDQLDDGPGLRRDWLKAPPAPRWRGDVHGDSVVWRDATTRDGSVRPPPLSVKRGPELVS